MNKVISNLRRLNTIPFQHRVSIQNQPFTYLRLHDWTHAVNPSEFVAYCLNKGIQIFHSCLRGDFRYRKEKNSTRSFCVIFDDKILQKWGEIYGNYKPFTRIPCWLMLPYHRKCNWRWPFSELRYSLSRDVFLLIYYESRGDARSNFFVSRTKNADGYTNKTTGSSMQHEFFWRKRVITTDWSHVKKILMENFR